MADIYWSPLWANPDCRDWKHLDEYDMRELRHLQEELRKNIDEGTEPDAESLIVLDYLINKEDSTALSHFLAEMGVTL